MGIFEASRSIHILFGFLALVGFWGAALATKGSGRHRWFGRLYLGVMTVLLTVTMVMAAGMVIADEGKRATFNIYISLISITSVWMAWRSIQDRDNIRAYCGLGFKLLCVLLGGYALFLLLVITPRVGPPAVKAMIVSFATLGLITCGAMVYRMVRGANHPRWWLSEHLTAMALNFGATHASMSVLGLGVLIPAVKEPWMRTAIITGWMLAALAVRIWAGRRFLTVTPRNQSAEVAVGASVSLSGS
jgi:hypothetical protein